MVTHKLEASYALYITFTLLVLVGGVGLSGSVGVLTALVTGGDGIMNLIIDLA